MHFLSRLLSKQFTVPKNSEGLNSISKNNCAEFQCKHFHGKTTLITNEGYLPKYFGNYVSTSTIILKHPCK